MTIDDALKAASQTLAAAGISEPRREAGSLLEICLRKPRAFMIAHPEYELTPDELTRYKDHVSRRAAGEPFHYIAGSREFFGLEFKVSPAVLIPRPETEMVVEAAIEFLRDRESPEFLEIGVGSGCISISILVNVPAASAFAVDISPEALDVARENAVRHVVAERLKLQISDVYQTIEPKRFDLIVTNPPYVPASDIDGLQTEVRAHEPVIALTDGGDGLSIIERIIRGAPEHLKSGGVILIEIGFAQAKAVAAMFDPAVWSDAAIIPDIRSIPRMASARLR